MARFIVDEIHTMRRKNTIAMKLMAKLTDIGQWGYSGTPIEDQPRWAIGAFLGALGTSSTSSWDGHHELAYMRGQMWERLNKLYNQCINSNRLDKLSTEEFKKKFQELLTEMRTLVAGVDTQDEP
jgi:SNF2 domain-containing protein